MIRNRSLSARPAARLAAAAVAFYTAAACIPSTEPVRFEEEIGFIKGFNLDDPRVVAPDTVDRGESFTVSVTTYGGGCVRKGRTAVSAEGLLATVTPYDVTAQQGVCATILLSFEHEAILQFDRAGVARVIVRGRQAPSGQVISEEHSVVVR